MMRLLLPSLILTGCQTIAGVFASANDPVEVRIIETRGERTLRRARLRCNYRSDTRDTLDLLAIAESPRWVYTDAEIEVKRTALCTKMLATPPQTGCPCTGSLCVQVDRAPLCHTAAWLPLIKQAVWRSPALPKLWTQDEIPHNAVRLRWLAPKQLVVEHGARTHTMQSQWRVEAGGTAHRCPAEPPFDLDPSGVERFAERVMTIQVAGTGCAVHGDTLRIAPALMARLETVTLDLQVPVHREWRTPTERYDTWWIRAFARPPGR